MTEQFTDDELRRIIGAENTAHDATHRQLATELLAARTGDSAALLAKLRRWVDDEIADLKDHRKIVAWDRDGTPKFQYSHDSARYEVLAQVARMLRGSGE